MLLDAIAASGGQPPPRRRGDHDRAASRTASSATSPIDASGDTTLNQMRMYRIRDGRLRFETVVTPAPELLASG